MDTTVVAENTQSSVVSKEVDSTEVVTVSLEVEATETSKASKDVDHVEVAVASKEVEASEKLVITQELEAVHVDVATKEVEASEKLVISEEVEAVEVAVASKEVEASEKVVVSQEVESVHVSKAPVVSTNPFDNDVSSSSSRRPAASNNPFDNLPSSPRLTSLSQSLAQQIADIEKDLPPISSPDLSSSSSSSSAPLTLSCAHCHTQVLAPLLDTHRCSRVSPVFPDSPLPPLADPPLPSSAHFLSSSPIDVCTMLMKRGLSPCIIAFGARLPSSLDVLKSLGAPPDYCRPNPPRLAPDADPNAPLPFFLPADYAYGPSLQIPWVASDDLIVSLRAAASHRHDCVVFGVWDAPFPPTFSASVRRAVSKEPYAGRFRHVVFALRSDRQVEEFRKQFIDDAAAEKVDASIDTEALDATLTPPSADSSCTLM